MELRHVRYFLAVAEELSFTRAAVRLHVAQPALSSQIRRLEFDLGVQLFDRSRRSISLTAAGEVMLAESRRLLASVEQVVDLVRSVEAGDIGSLRIGFVPSALNTNLPFFLRSFGLKKPTVRVILHEYPPDEMVKRLASGSLDLCFLYLPVDVDELDQMVITSESFVAAVPCNHPLAAKSALHVHELRDEPFVTTAMHSMPGLHARVWEMCAEAGFTPEAVLEDIWLLQSIVNLVAAGVGVAIVPASCEAIRRSGVTYRRLVSATAHHAELGAVWRANDRSPTLAAFLRDMRAFANTPTQ